MKKKPTEHMYRLTWAMDAPKGGITGDQARKEGVGACDAMFLASIIYPADGSLSVLFVSKDGRTNKELSDHEWFKVFVLLAARLGSSVTLDPGRIALAQVISKVLCDALIGKGHTEKNSHDEPSPCS